jgi:putative phosphoribosyl transferase
MFQDRKHAGELLAGLLESYRGQAGTVVLGLARGGVPVAAAVARELALPLDVFVVRKIGAPHQPELAIGAVASGGVIVLDERAVQAMQLSQAELDLRVAQEREELLRRERLYRGERPPLALAGQTVLLVDDGLATGYTTLAAVRAVRQQLPAAIVVAVPVAPPETLNRLRADVDEIVCVDRAERLFAVGQFYEDFSQTSDEQVQRELSGGRPA